MSASPFSPTSQADSPHRGLSPADTPPTSTSSIPDPIAVKMSSNNIPGPKLRRKKNVKKGIQFCLMVCGASGTGRTTFVNTLCQKSVLPHLSVN